MQTDCLTIWKKKYIVGNYEYKWLSREMAALGKIE
jgi:hypothetical protein